MRLNIKKFFVISILAGVAVGFAGHYYAMHDPKSNKDVILAYVLGLSVSVFCFFYLVKLSVARLKKESSPSQSLAEEIQQADPAYYDHEFYFNHLIKGIYLVLYVAMLSGGLYIMWTGRLIIAGLLIVPASFLVPFSYKEFMDKGPQIRIAATGIWIKDFGYKPWEAVQRIYLRKYKSGKSVVAKLQVYLLHSNDDSPDCSIGLTDIKHWKEIKNIMPLYPQVKFESDY